MTLFKSKFQIIGIFFIIFSNLMLILEFFFNINIKILRNLPSLTFLPSNISFRNSGYDFIGYNDYNFSFISIILLVGLLITSLSEIKNENEKTKIIRFETFILSLKIYVYINIIIFIFVWGISFLYLTTLNIFLPLIIYNLIFYFRTFNLNKKKN